MLYFSLGDQIHKAPNTAICSSLCMTRVGYYYHSVNKIRLNLSQSDHIKCLTLVQSFQCVGFISNLSLFHFI